VTDYILLIGAVLAGGSAAIFFRNQQHWLPYLVSFSGAYLFAIIVFHLLPEIYGTVSGDMHAHHHNISSKTAGIFLLAGLLFQMLLEYFSHGVEHAHSHKHNHGHSITVGVLLGLFLHAFTEGLPVHQLHSHHYLYGILVHKIPIAFVLAGFLLQSRLKVMQVLLILILFSFMTPLGTLLGEKSHFLLHNHVYVSAFVAGVLTHISTVIIFESDIRHKIPVKKLAVMLLAFVLAYLN
jgi:zinc transporter ZupT